MRGAVAGGGAWRGAAALVLAAACGGGGSSSSASSPSYPSVTGSYGSYAGTSPGASQRRWIAPDGTSTRQDCWAVTSIPNQDGARFSGTVQRLDPCNDSATISGTVATDGSITFTLTQGRWASCTMTGGGQYTGVVHLGSLLANGRITALCDDGRSMTIEEQLTGSLSPPPTTPG